MAGLSRVSGLQRLTEMVFLAEQAKLRGIEGREMRLKGLLADLQTATQREMVAGPAAVAGADVHWRKWIYQRRIVLNTELAQVRALKEAQTDRLRLAFGKNLAARKALEASLRDEKTAQQKRSDQTS